MTVSYRYRALPGSEKPFHMRRHSELWECNGHSEESPEGAVYCNGECFTANWRFCMTLIVFMDDVRVGMYRMEHF
jgi:hypothetical protein